MVFHLLTGAVAHRQGNAILEVETATMTRTVMVPLHVATITVISISIHLELIGQLVRIVAKVCRL